MSDDAIMVTRFALWASGFMDSFLLCTTYYHSSQNIFDVDVEVVIIRNYLVKHSDIVQRKNSPFYQGKS